MSKALYRKYRSKSLDEVIGQSHITDILARALQEGKIAHAYLFTGPRGVGKTSIARILAHEINNLPYDEDANHLDIIEIDAASNNGVEDIRDLRERVRIAPVSAAKKVYIIDEVHMLSKAAFNALLKTLEEPPEHTVFILATTDADKLPATIISRTQQFNFRTIPTKEAAQHLSEIAKKEGFSAESEALELIAIHGEGSFRDSISLLDQLRGAVDAKTGITKQLVESFLGLPPNELVQKLLGAYKKSDLATIVALLDEAEQTGTQPVAVAAELIRTIRGELSHSPELIPLLNKLIDVAQSNRPDIKLLVALAPTTVAAPVKPKTVALAAPEPVIVAPVEETTPVASPQPKPESPKPAASTSVTPARFDWQTLVQHVKANHVAIFTVLSKCHPVLDGNVLTLYASNGFYKKKLDDAKYRNVLHMSLDEVGMGGLTIETIGAPAPPSDETAASVAAIMGGGSEFTLEETGEGA